MKKGQAIAISEGEARAKFGDILVTASLGAQIKDDTGPEIRIRMLFDGTNEASPAVRASNAAFPTQAAQEKTPLPLCTKDVSVG